MAFILFSSNVFLAPPYYFGAAYLLCVKNKLVNKEKDLVRPSIQLSLWQGVSLHEIFQLRPLCRLLNSKCSKFVSFMSRVIVCFAEELKKPTSIGTLKGRFCTQRDIKQDHRVPIKIVLKLSIYLQSTIVL